MTTGTHSSYYLERTSPIIRGPAELKQNTINLEIVSIRFKHESLTLPWPWRHSSGKLPKSSLNLHVRLREFPVSRLEDDYSKLTLEHRNMIFQSHNASRTK